MVDGPYDGHYPTLHLSKRDMQTLRREVGVIDRGQRPLACQDSADHLMIHALSSSGNYFGESTELYRTRVGLVLAPGIDTEDNRRLCFYTLRPYDIALYK